MDRIERCDSQIERFHHHPCAAVLLCIDIAAPFAHVIHVLGGVDYLRCTELSFGLALQSFSIDCCIDDISLTIVRSAIAT